LWSRWQALLGCLGFALVPQAVALATVGPAACGTAPAMVGAALGIALTTAIGSPTQASGDGDAERGLRRWRPFWATVPAWSASLLLMLQPVKTLVRVVQHFHHDIIARDCRSNPLLADHVADHWGNMSSGNSCRRGQLSH